MMTKLLNLKNRLEQLPETQKRKRLLGAMQQYQLKLTETEKQLATAQVDEQYANSIFGVDSVAVVEGERKKAARIAIKLGKKLREDIEAVNNPRARINDTVTSLGEIGTGLAREVKNAWNRLIDQKLKPYEKLVDVARKLKMEGADQLAVIMQQLRSARDHVPTSRERAEHIARSLRNLPAAVQKLGFEDPVVQKFVEDAVDGKAKLKAFADHPAIAEFIQKYKLWDLFRVTTI
jgi:hypothetical protein